MPEPIQQLGPYKLGKKLGQGGMGAVYEGVDIETGQAVAVKVLSAALAAEEGFRGRFEAEIESLKKLRHPNIVRLFGYGEQDGSMFYAMERVEGTSLEEEIRQGRRFDWREVTQITIKMCRALKHAHDHGIIHRDIKPANILMSHDGEVKLSDFGIARLFGNTRMTSDGGVLGTAEYMAPEQADGRPVTDRCDQYSLGGVMYALLAGRPPFRASSFVEMLQMQRFSEPQSVRRYAPDTPAELDRIIAQLLEKDPAKRFVNTMMLARVLEAMEKGLSVSSARDDFVVADPKRTAQPHLTGLDPYAATLVPTDEATADGGLPAAGPADGTLVPPDTATVQQRKPPQPTAKFTKVEESGEHRAPWYGEAVRDLLAPQSLALVAALIAVIAVGWTLLRPLSADELYSEISTTVGDGDLENLKKAEPQIDKFVERFPNDPRVDQVKNFKQQIELSRRARIAKITARSPDKAAHMSPIERSYIEASSLAVTQPDAAIAKLQAIVDLYGDVDKNVPGHEFVAIARQDLEKLKEQAAESTAEQAKFLEARIEHIREIEKQDPAMAKRMWHSIIELYSGKPWAAEMVAAARQSLEKLASKP